ncbi:MAG: GerMN domain-containing protein [Chloroflexi bacterium]|nr:GerMN domain-containing protein [Chloroflexota bacterium]
MQVQAISRFAASAARVGMRAALALSVALGALLSAGAIPVAAESPSDDPFKAYGSDFRFTADGADPSVLVPDGAEVTAFAWASPATVAATSRSAEEQPQPVSASAPASEIRHEIAVFFSKRPESDADFSAVFPVSRMADDAGVARHAMLALLQGPTADERAQGYFSEVGAMLVGPSTCGGERFTLRIVDGAATLKLCQQPRSAGIGQDARARSAIEATLRQFPTVQRVTLLSADGDCLFDESGENRCLRP